MCALIVHNNKVLAVSDWDTSNICILDFCRGNDRRSTASTDLNNQSSRSHAVFTLNFSQTKISAKDNEEVQTKEITSKIYLVDLAGIDCSGSRMLCKTEPRSLTIFWYQNEEGQAPTVKGTGCRDSSQYSFIAFVTSAPSLSSSTHIQQGERAHVFSVTVVLVGIVFEYSCCWWWSCAAVLVLLVAVVVVMVVMVVMIIVVVVVVVMVIVVVVMVVMVIVVVVVAAGGMGMGLVVDSWTSGGQAGSLFFDSVICPQHFVQCPDG